MGMISLVGLNKADVLAALYNASKPQGMGFMRYDPKSMTLEEAEDLLKRATYFDYLKGRVMKVDLSGDELDPWGYDRDNGEGSVERVIAELRETGKTDTAEIQQMHTRNILDSAADTEPLMIQENTMVGTNVVILGLAESSKKLRPAVQKAVLKHRKQKK